MNPSHIDSIIALSRAMGDPANDWAILAEGNASALLSSGSMLIKASGASMRTASAEDFVEVNLAPLLQLLDEPHADDLRVEQVLLHSRVHGGRRPSVEAILHAVCLTLGESFYVGHTHPTAVNSLLCSNRASELVAGPLFPDQVVVTGEHPLLIPYTDPGLMLGRRVRADLQKHIERHGEVPKVIYLLNHGMFALGQSTSEVLQITEMATKSARILLGALAVGRPVHMSASESRRIDSRSDEKLRRIELANMAGSAQRDAPLESLSHTSPSGMTNE